MRRLKSLKEDETYGSIKEKETINKAVESNDIENQVHEYISIAREEDKDKEQRKNNLIFNLNESRKEALQRMKMMKQSAGIFLWKLV